MVHPFPGRINGPIALPPSRPHTVVAAQRPHEPLGFFLTNAGLAENWMT
jgi:hypothetical protein